MIKRCIWTLAKGQVGKRKFDGCFSTRAEAERAASAGWVPVVVPPPGVPLQARRRRKKRK
jgi:hypothetical protein